LCGSLSDIKSWISSPSDYSRRLTAWRNEKYGSRRYLTGLFRGAYPASIIGSVHVAALWDLDTKGHFPGTITPLVENNLWIWELTNSETVRIETLLSKAGLLIE